MSKKHAGKNTEFARFKRVMARLDARLEKQKHEDARKGRESKDKLE